MKTLLRRRRKRKARVTGHRNRVLLALAMMFGLAGVLRLGSLSAPAIAAIAAGGDGTDSVGAVCETPPDLAEVLQLVRAREDKVTEREAALEDRMQALAVAEEQIARNLAALEAAEARLESAMALSSTAAEDDLARLTSVYENMKPKEASAVFAQMDPQFAAGFLGRMRPEAAAAILAGLDPEKAYTISVLLAGRNAEAPTD